MDMNSGSRRLNKIGQAMYRKGQEKRRTLVDATAELLKETSFADLKPGDIARRAGTSKSNFYLYFDDVRAAVLAAVQAAPLSTPGVLATLDATWTGKDRLFQVETFVASYLQQWQAHAQVLRVRTSLVAEGDLNFKAAEEKATLPLVEALARKIAARQAEMRAPSEPPHALSLASCMIAMLDRMAAYGPESLNSRGVTPTTVIRAAASMIGAMFAEPAQRPATRGLHRFDARGLTASVPSALK